MEEDTCKKLEELAIEENWDAVEVIVPKVCNESEVLDTAYNTWMYHTDGNVRDLAGTVMESATIPEEKFVKMRPVIAEAMKKDTHKYAKFRFACALASHDPKEFTGKVVAVLQSRRDDPEEESDVRDIAKSYITKLDK